MDTKQEEILIYDGFLISVLLKGIISVGEVLGGIALFFIPPAFIVGIATIVLNHLPLPSLQGILLTEVAKYTTGTVVFVALYLLSRGLIKVVLIGALLKNMLWAYPASLVVLAGFVLYQLYQIFSAHSLLLVAVTLFDLIVMYFIWREWKIVERHQGHVR